MIDVFKPVNITIEGNDQYVRNTQPNNENCDHLCFGFNYKCNSGK